MKFILGKKLNMIQYFTPEGLALPATLVRAEPNIVTQVKSKETDGYEAVLIGFENQKSNRLSKPVLGKTKELGSFKYLKEFRLIEASPLKRGDKIDLSIFEKGDKVLASGISKGKGFQGVVKRHGFGGGRRTHGQKHSEREPGSIGGGLRTRIPVGMRMAGRMGGDRVTVKNLKIIDLDLDNNLVVLSGAIPGRRGSLIEIRSNRR